MQRTALLTVLSVLLVVFSYWDGASNSAIATSHESFPTKPINWLVPYAPGGAFDLHSRAAAGGLRKHLGVPVVIKNVPGAGGVIGWNMLWASEPDGHTVGIVNLPGAIVTELFGKPKPQYRLRNFSWVGRVSEGPYMWVAGVNTPYRSLEHLRQAREVLITDTGVGSTAQVLSALTAEVMGFRHRFILGYPGAPAATAAILRGEGEGRAIPMDSSALMRFVHEGQMIPLWIYADKRDPEFPNVPTVAELGYPELAVFSLQRVVAAPPGVPKDRVSILQMAFAEALAEPEVVNMLKKMEAKPAPLATDDLKRLMETSSGVIQKYSKVFIEAIQ